MSPIPSPTPLRRTIARLLFSPAGLLCGFVVLLIFACPGARGDDGMRGVAADNPVLASTKGLMDLGFQSPSSEAPRPRVIGRSTRFDNAARSSARSATPSEREARAKELFRHSHTALPMLVDPTRVDDQQAAVASLRPMTGPTVGIRSKLPHEKR